MSFKNNKVTDNKVFALILGGYVNGYSIVRELFENGVKNIAVFSNGHSIASVSNMVKYNQFIDDDPITLKQAILKLKKQANHIIIFPTADNHLENLHAIYNDIKGFCFIPFNKDSLLKSLNKKTQYKFCEEYNIPYPKTVSIANLNDLELIREMVFPILIKPTTRIDITNKDVFRNLYCETNRDFVNSKNQMMKFIESGVQFIASEVIPGDDTNIHAYVAYRSPNGQILNEWIGRKLNQFPNKFGVFSSAINESNEMVRKQGKVLINKMNLYGICQPEFKFDYRDNTYKLMEINLRSMMWHRVGNLSGVNLQFTQYLDAQGIDVQHQPQDLENKVHFVFFYHELYNLIKRKKYMKYFLNNIFKAKKVEFAVFNKNDLKPFFYMCIFLVRSYIKSCLKQLKIR